MNPQKRAVALLLVDFGDIHDGTGRYVPSRLFRHWVPYCRKLDISVIFRFRAWIRVPGLQSDRCGSKSRGGNGLAIYSVLYFPSRMSPLM